MELILWNAAIVVSKAVFYVGFASVVGFAFFMHRPAQNRAFCKNVVYHVVPLLALSFFASALWFFAKTGAFSESGLQGAFDPIMLEVMIILPPSVISGRAYLHARKGPRTLTAMTLSKTSSVYSYSLCGSDNLFSHHACLPIWYGQDYKIVEKVISELQKTTIK